MATAFANERHGSQPHGTNDHNTQHHNQAGGDWLAPWEKARRGLLAKRERAVADLPLRYLRQSTHFTVPASDEAKLRKAARDGCAATASLLAKYRITPEDLATALDLPLHEIEAELAAPPNAALVLVDGEDAQALRDDVVLRGRRNAVAVFREENFGPALRFYRPSGLHLDYCLRDLDVVLTDTAARSDSRTNPAAHSDSNQNEKKFPIDGIIWPKPESVDELIFIDELLGEFEHRIGLEENHLKLQFLVESPAAVDALPQMASRTRDRLCGIIFGIADYAASVGLPTIRNDHPICAYARAAIINTAAAVGVPAIDNMTLNYPVADKSLSDDANRARILARLREAFDDATNAANLGMTGKWVGHPLQLFVVRLAFRLAMPTSEVNREVANLKAYAGAVDGEKGTTVIAGVMTDRAGDRHTRMRLRRAVALGLLDPHEAQKLGVITPAEAVAAALLTS